MAGEIAKAYVQILPTTKGIAGSLENALNSSAETSGKSAGASIANGIKNAVLSAGIGTAIVSTVKNALEAGGELEQTLGGIETLFGNSYDTVVANAKKASKELQISANEYMQQATSFSASLLQSTGNDAEKSAQIADIALRDMSDNANKMGTDITSIQTAYQGFAKQNYTMLDNLKIGYGGTKTEMQRLLADAQNLSGIEYNIDSLADVYSAIHVIQENLGLTGVSAEEAKTTLQGSFASMKSATTDLLGNMAIGEDISDEISIVAETTSNYIHNLIPMAVNVLKGLVPVFKDKVKRAFDSIPDLISKGRQLAGDIISGIQDKFPEMLAKGGEIAENIITGAKNFLPQIVEFAQQIPSKIREVIDSNKDTILSKGGETATFIKDGFIAKIPEFMENYISNIQGWINTLSEFLPEFLQNGKSLFMSIVQGAIEKIPDLIEITAEIISEVISTVLEFLPSFLETGTSILITIVTGIIDNLPKMVDSALEIVTALTDTLLDCLPEILESGANIILQLVHGIIENFPKITGSAVKIVAKLTGTIAEHLPDIIESGFGIITKLAVGLINAVPDLVSKIPEIISSIVNAFGEFDWLSIGEDIICGIGDGITSMAGSLVESVADVCLQAYNAVIDFFEIGSPSKLMAENVGRFIPAGIAVGIDKNISDVEKAMQEVGTATLNTDFNTAVPIGSSEHKTINNYFQNTIYAEVASSYDVYRLNEDLARANRQIKGGIGL